MRAASENLMAQLKAAGVEVDPKAAFRALQMFGGEGFEKTNGLDGLHEAMRRGEDGEGDGEGEGESGSSKK
jgi:hypothetical protein